MVRLLVYCFGFGFGFAFGIVPAGLVLFLLGSSAALILSSSWPSRASSASFLRVRSMTSSVVMTLRPACLEKRSRSWAEFWIWA